MKTLFTAIILATLSATAFGRSYDLMMSDAGVVSFTQADLTHNFKAGPVVIQAPKTIDEKELEDGNDYLFISHAGDVQPKKVLLKDVIFKTTVVGDKNEFVLSDATKGTDITCIYLYIVVGKSAPALLKLHIEGADCSLPTDLKPEYPSRLPSGNDETDGGGRANLSGGEKHTHKDVEVKKTVNTKADCDCDDQEKHNPNLYYYDFRCKSFYKANDTRNPKVPVNIASEIKLKNKDYVQFRITNINRYLYDIDVQSADVSYTSEVPMLFRQLFIGDSLGLLGKLFNNFTSRFPASELHGAVNEGADNNELNRKYNNFKNKLLEFNDYYNTLEGERLKAYYVCDTFSCCDQSNFSLSYANLAEQLLDVRMSLNELQAFIGKDKAVAVSRKNLSDYLSEQKSCAETDEAIATLEEKARPLRAIEKPSADQKAQLDAIDKKLIEPNEKKCSSARKTPLKQLIDLEQENLRLAADIQNLQATLPTETELKKLFLFVQNVRKQHSTFITPPLYARGNRLELIIKTKRNDSSLAAKWDIMPLYDDSLYISIPVVGKPIISFSSGSFIGFGMKNKTYTWQPVLNSINQISDTSQYILVEQGYTYPPIGFSALMHVEWKTRGATAYGASVGVGLTIERDPRIAYLLGGSMFFGDLHQLAITGGIAGIKTNRLANNYQYIADKGIVFTNAQKPEPVYYPEFKTGVFLSLTYTLFGTDVRTLYRAERRKAR